MTSTEFAAQRRKQGLCTDCGSPSQKHARCQACSDRAAATARERMRAKKKAHTCTRCGNPAEPWKSRCRPCLDKARADSAARYARHFKSSNISPPE